MGNWKVELPAGGQYLAAVEKKRGIFQNELPLLLFLITEPFIKTIQKRIKIHSRRKI